MVVAVEEQVDIHRVDRVFAVVDVVVADFHRIVVGGVRTCVGNDNAPLLVGGFQHALAPLQLLLDDLSLLVGRGDFVIQDDEDRIAVFNITHRAVKLGITGLGARHIEALCEGDEVPVALHFMVAGDG